ncbi:SDR family oxidoreductase, partial [Rhodococcus sp. LB1]|uniref:SDR family oxidoreductase n=1 Tax=Rhodococcus sp. LB1 TaxID=1807499 RepID=UPI0012E83CD1
TSQESVEALASRLAAAGTTLDALVHVAGVMWLDELGTIDYDLVRKQIEINTLGPLRTVEALRSLLQPGAKVGI